jgi:hypothetical protein
VQASISEAIGPPSAPPSGPVFWYSADVGVTKDGGNLVSGWGDRSANLYDVAALGALPTNKPTWTANVLNGLPMLDWGQNTALAASVKSLQRNILVGDAPAIKLLGARSMFAVVKPDQWAGAPATVGGSVVSLDSSTGSLMMQMLQTAGVQEGMDGSPGTYYQLNSVVDYKGVAIMVDWGWGGSTDRDNITVAVNGVPRLGTLQPGGTHFAVSNNVPRINLGYDNGAAYTGWTWSGMIGEIICYAGQDATVAAITRAYLKGKWGL